MAAFDAAKDKTLAVETFGDDDDGTIEVKVAQYGDGDPKIQISRYADDEEGQRKFKKLKRLTIREALELHGKLGILLDLDKADTDASE
jgi:hypothetical protein